MAELLAEGCEGCNEEIATAIAEMPAREGFMNAGTFLRRGAARSRSADKIFLLDGEQVPHTELVVLGPDGLCLTRNMRHESPCACGSGKPHTELWAGEVTHEPLPEPDPAAMVAHTETWEEAMVRGGGFGSASLAPDLPRAPARPLTPKQLAAGAAAKLKAVGRIEQS